MTEPGELIPSPERLLGLGEPLYSAVEVSEKTGLNLEDAKRLWRAMGFVVVPEEEVFFTEGDVEVLQELAEFMRRGFADLQTVLGTTRTMSQSVARITETEVDAMRDQLAKSPDLAERVVASDGKVASEAFEALERFLSYVWRRHLADALQRAQVLEAPGAEVQMTVGFADLVGFTRLSRDLDEEHLEGIIERFESTAQEAATSVGARIVKTIGDEVMFVADDAPAAAEMALSIVDACSVEGSELEVRVGLAIGALTPHHGDYFGPTVNLASRSARAARPNTVLVSQEFRDELESDGFELKPIPQRRLKGIGSPQLYVLRRATA